MNNTIRACMLLLLTTIAAGTQADVLSERFELLAAPRDRDPYSLEFPLRIREPGLVEIFITITHNEDVKKPKLGAALLHGANLMVLKQKSLETSKLQYFEYPVDSPLLRKSNDFVLRINNFQTRNDFRGVVTVRYPGPKPDKPDLALNKVYIPQTTCKLTYYLQNLGPGPIPYAAWDKKDPLEVGIKRNSQLWSAEALYRVDPNGQLAHPNPNLQFEHHTELVISDQHPDQITFLIDRRYHVAEADENNAVTQMLTCPRPDLVVRKVYLDQECRVSADIENVGIGKLDMGAYASQLMAHVLIRRNGQGWGGTTFSQMDPQRALAQPGGKVTYVSALKLGAGAENIQVIVDDTNKVKESNDNNNAASAELKCQPTPKMLPAQRRLAPLQPSNR